MNKLLRLEEAAMFGLSIYLNSLLPFEWWIFWALLVSPDIGMLGYLINTRIGAISYNLFHHKGIALIVSFWVFILPAVNSCLLVFCYSGTVLWIEFLVMVLNFRIVLNTHT